MKFASACADTYLPDGSELTQALARCTHMGIGAHADDLEMLAWHGIEQCYNHDSNCFVGVVITDGAGSPRSGPYADYSDSDMAALRREEQRRAAARGKYSAQVQLGYTSRGLKGEQSHDVVADLLQLLAASRPRVVYLHNLADSHATHVAAALATISALRQLPRQRRPAEVYGVEIWRSLDWLPSPYRVELEVSADNSLQGELLREFDSQLSGGKRYDRAVTGRQAANATFSQSHATDRYEASVLAMDLSPLLRDTTLPPQEFLCRIVNELSHELLRELAQHDFQ